MNFGILQFPGSNCDQDALRVLRNVFQVSARYVWHKDTAIEDLDAIIVPGGFSYGDYLRCGAIARFSPAMKAVKQAADRGVLVLGICNGFQILCESGLLPGALVRNRQLKFACEYVNLRVETNESPFTRLARPGAVWRIPIAHGEGCYFASPEILESLRKNNQILVRYASADGSITPAANPNGSLENIAGVCNAKRNVFGLMPHPERATEKILGSEDGRHIFESMIQTLRTGKVPRAA